VLCIIFGGDRMAREMKFDMNNMKKILKTECHAKVTLWKKKMDTEKRKQ